MPRVFYCPHFFASASYDEKFLWIDGFLWWKLLVVRCWKSFSEKMQGKKIRKKGLKHNWLKNAVAASYERLTHQLHCHQSKLHWTVWAAVLASVLCWNTQTRFQIFLEDAGLRLWLFEKDKAGIEIWGWAVRIGRFCRCYLSMNIWWAGVTLNLPRVRETSSVLCLFKSAWSCLQLI